MQFPRIFARKSREPRATYGQSLITSTASAVHVSADNALNSSAVYAGIRYLSQTVGQLPWNAYEPKKGGGSETLTAERFSGVRDIMMNLANPRMGLSAQKFREVMIQHAILYGNGVAEIERNAAGRAVGLFPLRPESLVFRSPNGEDLEYVYKDQRRGEIVFTTDEVFHISNFGTREDFPSVGVSVIEYAAEAIGWQRATEMFGASYFANGIHPSVIITLKNALSPEAYKLFMEELNNKFSGARGQHQPFVTDGEATVEKLTVQPDESQFVQSLQHQIDDIARWIGVPPSKIGHMIHSGVRANVEHASIEVIQDAVLPWVRRFEQEADAKFFRPGEAYFTRMDLAALMRGDSAARSEYYRTMRNLGAFSANMILEAEGLNPLAEGMGGDLHLVQGQYVPLNRIESLSSVSSEQEVKNEEPNRPESDRLRPTEGRGRQTASLSDEEADAEFRRTSYLFGDRR